MPQICLCFQFHVPKKVCNQHVPLQGKTYKGQLVAHGTGQGPELKGTARSARRTIASALQKRN